MNRERSVSPHAPQVKTLAGQENAVSELVRVVRVSEGDKSVLKAALGALAVLSSDDRNLKKMIAEGHAHHPTAPHLNGEAGITLPIAVSIPRHTLVASRIGSRGMPCCVQSLCSLSSLLERSSKDRDERIIMFVNQLGERLHND